MKWLEPLTPFGPLRDGVRRSPLMTSLFCRLLAHADGRNAQPLDFIGVPPVGRAQHGNLLVDRHLRDESPDIRVEEGLMGHWMVGVSFLKHLHLGY